MKNWKNSDKIFIQGADRVVTNTNQLITKELLDRLDCPIEDFAFIINKPCDNIELMDGSMALMYIEQLSFKQDGSMEREYIYHRYPKDTPRTKVNNHPALTPWGQTIFDRAIDSLEKAKLYNEEEDW